MLKLYFIFTVILILVSNNNSQSSISQFDNELTPQIEALLLSANTLQPELTIDVSLKLISKGKVQNKKKVKQILEELFYLSFTVKEKIQRKVIAFEGEVLSNRETFSSNAYDNKLDALSLQIRIISELLKVDSVKAFSLFNEISANLSFSKLSCEDFLLFEFSDFYELVEKFAKNNFSEKDINEGKRIIFLSKYIENMTSSSQISPISKTLLNIKLTNDEINTLTIIFSNSLRKIYGDDRTFSFEMSYGAVNKDIYQLSRKIISKFALYKDLLNSYRDYLIKNLEGKRCQDNTNFEKIGENWKNEEKESPNSNLPIYVIEANKYFFNDSPIMSEEIKPYIIEKVRFPTSYYVNGQSKKVLDLIKNLQYWKSNNRTTSDIKDSLEWQTLYGKVLDEIENLEANEKDDEIDVYYQKSHLYRIVFRESSKIELRKKVTEKCLKLLDNKTLLKNNTFEWFSGFSEFQKEIKSLESDFDKKELLNMMENSNITSISIYLQLEKVNLPKAK